MNDLLSLKGRNSLSGVPAKSVERVDVRRGREGHLESSGHEEADDIFESEFTMLQDLWKFDCAPFPVTKQVRTHETGAYQNALCISATRLVDRHTAEEIGILHVRS